MTKADVEPANVQLIPTNPITSEAAVVPASKVVPALN